MSFIKVIMDSTQENSNVSMWNLWTGDTVKFGKLWERKHNEINLSGLYSCFQHSSNYYIFDQLSKPLYKRKPTRSKGSWARLLWNTQNIAKNILTHKTYYSYVEKWVLHLRCKQHYQNYYDLKSEYNIQVCLWHYFSIRSEKAACAKTLYAKL